MIDRPSSSLYNKHRGIFTPDFIRSEDITKHDPLILGCVIYEKNQNLQFYRLSHSFFL